MKGKHGAMADRRRAVEAAETELVALRHKNVQLLAEVEDLKSCLAVERRNRQDETRILRAEREEASAPLLRASIERYAAEQAAHQQTRAELKKLRSTWDTATHRIVAHFKGDHGMTGLEATEQLVLFCGKAAIIHDAKTKRDRDMSTEDVMRLQRARGERGAK